MPGCDAGFAWVQLGMGCEALGAAGDSCCAGNKYLGSCLGPGGGCVASNGAVPHLEVFLSSRLLLLWKVVLFLARVLV